MTMCSTSSIVPVRMFGLDGQGALDGQGKHGKGGCRAGGRGQGAKKFATV